MTQPARNDSAQMRLVAMVIAVTMLLWLGANWAGQHFGWGGEYAFLADLAAIAAFIWSLVVTWRIWRGGQPAAPEKKG